MFDIDSDSDPGGLEPFDYTQLYEWKKRRCLADWIL